MVGNMAYCCRAIDSIAEVTVSEVLTNTDVALYEEYTEVKEKVKAFQFEGPHQVAQIVKQFTGDDRNWSLTCRSGKYTLTFPSPKKAKPVEVKGKDIVYSGTITLTPALTSLGWYDANSTVMQEAVTIVEGSWVVERWSGTEHAELTVMFDKDFRRKYR